MTPREKEAFRDRIATVDASGKRVWIYPKKPKGRYYQWRTYVSWALLAFLFGAPFVKIHGEPMFLFDILERKFILFGLPFMPQDFHLFVLAMLTLVVFIILFTVVWGRLFCGWVCPQTIFMEMVFRKIEYWIEGDANQQRKLAQMPWTREKIFKRLAKYGIFFAIAVLVANTFLAWIIGVDRVIQIASEPIAMHKGGFTAMLLFSGAFFFVFSYLREQVCVAICPYGRLQGVLLDDNSVVVIYDFVRGEPRGKLRKQRKKADLLGAPQAPTGRQLESPSQEGAARMQGDCVDCKLCVQVCPTGIDIRNGTQLECINCTACIDACDAVMDKIGRPRGLIRYDSYNGIVEGRKTIWTPRVIGYTVVLALLVALNVVLLSTRGIGEAVILRQPGFTYKETAEGLLMNLYQFKVYNKTTKPMPIDFRLLGQDEAIIKVVGLDSTLVVPPGEMAEGNLIVELPKEEMHGKSKKIFIEVVSGNKRVDKVKTNFLGPFKF